MRTIGAGIVVGVAWAAVAAAQSVTVQSPNGGEQWKTGTSHTITWVLTGPTKASALDIVLIKGSTELGVIAQNVPVSPTSRSWVVGQHSDGTAPVGTDYKVGIRETGSTEQDTSNASFSITPAIPPPPAPVILKLTAPNGGEGWRLGSPRTISWQSTNLVGKVKLELVREPNDPAGVIAIDLPANGSLPWSAGALQVGTASSGEYRVRVRSQANPARYDDSDQTFRLIRVMAARPMPHYAVRKVTRVPATIQNWLGIDEFPDAAGGPQLNLINSRPMCDSGGNQRAQVGRDWFPYLNIQYGGLYRSRVSFSVAPYAGRAGELTSARLRLKQTSAVRTSSYIVSCASTVCEMLGPWTSFNGVQIANCRDLPTLQTEYTVDITATVRTWLDGSQPNHGLLLRGREAPTSRPWTCIGCFEATFELEF